MTPQFSLSSLPALPAVIPVLAGPLQVLLALLPGLLLGFAGLLISLFPRFVWIVVKLLWRFKLPIVIVLVIGGFGFWQAMVFWAKAGSTAASAQQSGDDWPMSRGGPSRTGAVSGSDEPPGTGAGWFFQPGKAAVYSSPAVVGNRVYISTAQTAVFGSGHGKIICLDADTGSVVWRSAPAGYRPTFSSPVVSGSNLVCGEGLHFTRDARVICLDLSPGNEGNVRWTFRTGSHVECTPVIHGGRVYVGAGDDGYYCFDLEPDVNGEPRVLWHLKGAEYPDAETSLVVHGNRVYAGLGRGGKAICVFDAETGEEIRRIATDHPVFSPPAVADGRLYIGMGSGDYVHRAEEIGQTPAGELWCLDLETMDVLWSHPVGRTILGSPAVAGDRVYFGSRDGFLYCLHTDGRLAAKFNAHAPIVTGPAVSDRYVYVVVDSGKLYALDRNTLERHWEQKISSGGLLVSSPAVARRHVFVGTERDGLICVPEPGEEEELALWPAPSGGALRGGNLDNAPAPPLGAFHWQFPEDQTGETQESLVAAPVAAWGNHLYVPLAGGPQRRGIVCLPSDRTDQETPAPKWQYESPLGIYRSPVVRGDLLLAVDGQPGDANRRLHAIDRNTGAKRWRRAVEDRATGVLTCTQTHLFVADKPGALTCRDFEGKSIWSRDVGRILFPPTVAGSLLVSVTAEPARLLALDPPTGRTLWKVNIADNATTPPAVADATVYIGTTRGLVARSLVDGSVVHCPVSADNTDSQRHATKEPPPSNAVVRPNRRTNAGRSTAETHVTVGNRGPTRKPSPLAPLAGRGVGGEGSSDRLLVLTPEWIVFVTASGEVVVVERATRAVLASIDGALPGTSPLVVRDRIFFFGPDSLMTVPTDNLKATPVPWADTSWLGRPTTPMVFCRSNVYVGMAGWGLVRLGESQ